MARTAVILTLFTASGLAAATPAAAAPLHTVLRAELHFTKDSYRAGDTVHLVVTLTNTGSTTLSKITTVCDHAGEPDELFNTGAGWGALRASAPGVTVPAHRSRTFDVTDRVPAGAARFGQVFAACDFGYRNVDTDRAHADDRAAVPGERGALAVQVVTSPDAAGRTAGVTGVRVVLRDDTGCPAFVRSATTDTSGNVMFARVPAGSTYLLYVYPPAGRKVSAGNPTHVQVLGHDTTRFIVELVRGSATAPTEPNRCAAPSTPAPSGTAPLAVTGTDPAGTLAAGLAALLLGLVLVRAGRRRPAVGN